MSDHPELHGVLPALITPFTEDGAHVDADALAALVERLVRAGVGGLVPGGSTGEFTTLTHDERRELVEVTVAAAAGRVPVVAGTGALSTRETVELSVHAERAGAAAVMVVPPFYDALSWRELLTHYGAVADAIGIPIMYYNLPSASGVTLTAAQFRELEAVGVTCLKDTGGDAVLATELVQTGGPTLLNGYDTLTFSALAAGVRAVVWGVASILPAPCVHLSGQPYGRGVSRPTLLIPPAPGSPPGMPPDSPRRPPRQVRRRRAGGGGHRARHGTRPG